MMRYISVFILLLAFAGTAYAASTAMNVVIGYLTTSGCPSGQSSCFFGWSSTTPEPAYLPLGY